MTMTSATTSSSTTSTATTSTTANTAGSTPDDADAVAAPHRDMIERLQRVLAMRHFFIVGCQKSGTTWVRRLLDGHARLRCHGEAYFGAVMLPLLKQVQQAYNSRQKAGELGEITDEQLVMQLRAVAALSMSRWIERDDGQWDDVDAIGEKTPEHSLCMPELARTFPGAKFIHVIRDGRDVCVSGWFDNLRSNGEQFRQRFPEMNSYIEYTLNNHWLPYIQRARAFGAAYPEQYLELHYETLHADPEAQIARLLRFLEVEDGAASIESCQKAGAFESLADGRAPGQEDRESFYRKGVPGDWRQHFDGSNIETFDRTAGQMRRALGYGG